MNKSLDRDVSPSDLEIVIEPRSYRELQAVARRHNCPRHRGEEIVDWKDRILAAIQTKMEVQALVQALKPTLGFKLEIEDIDVSGMGLYLKKDPNVPDDDYFDSGWTSLGRPLYQRKSEEGKKWHQYEDKGIVNLSTLLPKESK
jgi:hypothetical protein